MDYQRLVSYIYSYPEGVKGRNAGFAKALVHQGQFKLNISLRGVKTDSPEMFGIYMMVADGGYRLIKLGECLVKMGQMEYSGVNKVKRSREAKQITKITSQFGL